MRLDKVKERIKFLEKQIEVQQDALTWCNPDQIAIHSYLLEKVTNEWCELTRKYGEKLIQKGESI